MRKPTTLIAIAILALMLGACASTNDTADRPDNTTASNDNPTELPSIAERQDYIASTDISANATTKEVVVTEKPALESSATVTYPSDTAMTSSSTSTTNNLNNSTSTTTSSSTATSSTTNSSMTSSSTTDDTDDQDETATATRTRMRKD